MGRILNVSRRKFLGLLASTGSLVLAARPRRLLSAPAPGGTFTHGAFLAIAPDGTVTIYAHRSEMGTGVRTSLPMVLTDEMGASWEQVRVVQAPGDERFGDQNTDGSRSIREFYPVMREAGATARAMLETAAAAELGVPREECVARDHAVHHGPSGRSLPFGKLVARAAQLRAPRAKSLHYRSPAEYRYIGKGVPPVDRQDIVTGRATFGMDVRLEGMKYAAVARPPVTGGTVVSYDATECLKVPGVEQVVEMPATCRPYGYKPLGGIAVVARNTWAAFQGRAKLKVVFDAGDNGTYDSVTFRKELEDSARKEGKSARERGSFDEAFQGAAKKLEADYYVPHLAHASMEPPVATADAREDRCEVWAPTQNPQSARSEVADALDLDEENVTVHVTLLGGGFGRKAKADFVVEAALVSKQVKAPVKLVWSREDDIRHDYYHTVSAMHMKGGLDAGGRTVAWLQRVAAPTIRSTFLPSWLPMAKSPSDSELGMGFVDLPYDIPNLRCEYRSIHAHVRIGWFRAVANVYHAFAIGSFAAELAALAGRDPLQHLLELIGPPREVDLDDADYDNMDASREDFPVDAGRLRHVTEVAARGAGWGRPLPRGKGLGIACHRSFLSYVATVVEVDVTPAGVLAIPRVDTVIDCGRVINPDRVRAQMEGAVIFALSLARTGEITARDGAIVQSNFNDYPVMRIQESPKEIHVTLITSEAAPSGVGEPGVPPVAPALANAVFAATGKRFRSLPLARHDLRWS